MTLHDYMKAIRKRWYVLVLLTLLGAATGFAYGSVQSETYRTQSAVVVVAGRGDSTTELVQGSNYVEGLVATYSVVATSPVVLERVIDDLDLDITPTALARDVTVDSPLDTTVLEISVTGSDPSAITDIANSVASELAVAVEDLSPQTATEDAAVRVELIRTATEPQSPVAPNIRLLAIVGAMGGLLLGAVFAILRQLFATRIASREDVTEVTDIPILGEVSIAGADTTLPAGVRDSSSGSAAEAVRGVAAGLRFANVDGRAKVLLVTSPDAGDGKSSVALSLALIMAEQGQRVLHIDADLRRGTVADMTGLEAAVGLTTVLLGDIDIAGAAQSWGAPNLSVLTNGALPPNPGQLLASDHLRELLKMTRELFDVVIVDSPPALAVTDARWLAPAVDGIVIVARYRRTERDALERTISTLESTRTPIMGIVINGLKKTAVSPYYSRESTESAPRARRRAGH